MQHLLIKHATTRPYKESPELPTSAQYDIARGLWVEHGIALVSQEKFRSAEVTKKCDQETGEDQKGE